MENTNINEIERWKIYKDYSEDELKSLPPLPGDDDFEFEKENYVWTGKRWERIWTD